jgi:hypothetical protein
MSYLLIYTTLTTINTKYSIHYKVAFGTKQTKAVSNQPLHCTSSHEHEENEGYLTVHPSQLHSSSLQSNNKDNDNDNEVVDKRKATKKVESSITFEAVSTSADSRSALAGGRVRPYTFTDPRDDNGTSDDTATAAVAVVADGEPIGTCNGIAIGGTPDDIDVA